MYTGDIILVDNSLQNIFKRRADNKINQVKLNPNKTNFKQKKNQSTKTNTTSLMFKPDAIEPISNTRYRSFKLYR